MWIGRLLNKALACVLRSCFTKKLKLCRSIPSSSLWSESCKACSQWLLCMPLSVCLSLTALETHSNSLFILCIPWFPQHPHHLCSFVACLSISQQSNHLSNDCQATICHISIPFKYMPVLLFSMAVWYNNGSDSSLYPIQDRKRLYIIAVLTSGIG